MMYTGRRLTANEAREAGLVARIVSSENLEKEIEAIAKSISAVPVLAMRQAKRCIGGAFETDRKGALALEVAAIDEQLAAGTWLGKK
jgi:enoyl-CoA hydratase